MFTSKSKSGINDPAAGSCSMLSEGAAAVVEGSVHCKQADIFGHVKGGLEISDLLQLKGKAIIDGDISTGKLMMENTVSFNGQCRMGANIVELNSEQLPKAVNG